MRRVLALSRLGRTLPPVRFLLQNQILLERLERQHRELTRKLEIASLERQTVIRDIRAQRRAASEENKAASLRDAEEIALVSSLSCQPRKAPQPPPKPRR